MLILSRRLYPLAAIPPRKHHWYRLNGKMGGPQSMSGFIREDVKPITADGIEPEILRCPAYNIVSVQTVPIPIIIIIIIMVKVKIGAGITQSV